MRKVLFYGAAGLTFLCSGLFFLLLLNKEIKHPQLPVYSEVQVFQLTDSQGEPFGSNELRGKIWIANFFFTTCADICPLMSKHLSSLQKALAQTDVELVSISVNPDTDTPEILAKYAEKYSSGQPKWHFLTGPIDAIKKLAVQSFKVGSIDEPVFHSDRFMLVDGRGRIRGYYTGTDEESLQQLIKDIPSLLGGHKR